jgi:AcrR family transcriptional regulator
MKEKKHEDRRIARTRGALTQALAELSQEKGYESVTVEEITSRANVGRTTFYLHYQSKEELLLEGLESHLSQLVDEITQRPLVFWFRESNNSLITSIFETVKENADIFSSITKEQSNKVYDYFRQMVYRLCMKLINESPWAQKKIDHITLPIDYIIDYFSGAIWASIIWWVRDDFKEAPEEMTNNFRLMFFPGLLRALRVKKFADLVESIGA